VPDNLTATIDIDGRICVTCPGCDFVHWACLRHEHEYIWPTVTRRHRRYHPEWYLEEDSHYIFEAPDPNLVHERNSEWSDGWLGTREVVNCRVTCVCGFDKTYNESAVSLTLLEKEWRVWHEQYERQAQLTAS